MKQLIILLSTVFLFSCSNDKNIPDVSDIKIDIEEKRFEQDFFSIDTNDIAGSIESLSQKYPGFTPDFIESILGLDMQRVMLAGDVQQDAVKMFINDYKSIKDTSDLLYKDFRDQAADIRQALKYVKYYFPDYELPKAIITFIGPVDANFLTSLGTQGDVLTSEGLGIGLQLHLGSNFSFYNSSAGQALYPQFISNNFDEAHITVNCMRNIIDDLFTEKSAGKSLLDQMIINGRKLYLLTRFLPHAKEYIILGYTKKQMDAAMENEGVVWDFFLNNDLLNNAEQNIVKNYIGESPKTQEFGEDSPGNLGSFSGLMIVKKYMEKFPETTMADLMQLDVRDIYSQSKYKPRN